MNKMICIIKREFLSKVFTRGFLIATLLGPILMVGLMLAPAYFMTMTSEKSLLIGIVEENRDFAANLRQIYPDTLSTGEPRLNFFSITTREYLEKAESYKSNVEAGIYHALLIIPPEVFDSLSVTYLAKTVSDIDLIQQLRNGLATIINNQRLQQAGFNPAEIKELMRQVDIHTIKIQKGEEQARGFDQEYLTAIIFLLILYMTIIMYGSSVMRSVIEEKSSRIIEVLLSSSSSFQLMMGKLIGAGAVGLIQYLIWTVMGAVVFLSVVSSAPALAEFIDIPPAIFCYFILFFIVGFFTFSTLYAATGAMCSDMQDAQSISAPITLLIVLPFMISFMVIKEPTSQIAQILSFLPFFTPLIMFLRILLINPPLWEILFSLLINILTIIFIIWITARIYRVGILMYGKRPNLPEILRWIRTN